MLCLWSMAGMDKAPKIHSTFRTLNHILAKESYFVVLTLVYSPKGKLPIMGYEPTERIWSIIGFKFRV
jgi:hypothetical protein